MKIWGFIPKPERIRGQITRHQTLMFSATIIPQVHNLVLKLTPKHEFIDLNKFMRPNKNSLYFLNFIYLTNRTKIKNNFYFNLVEHIAYPVSPVRKLALLRYFLYRHGRVSLKVTKNSKTHEKKV